MLIEQVNFFKILKSILKNFMKVIITFGQISKPMLFSKKSIFTEH